MIVEVEFETITGQSRRTETYDCVHRTDVQGGLFVLYMYGGEEKRYFPLSRVIQVTEQTSD